MYEYEIIEVENYKKEKDVILLFHIESTMVGVIRNNKDEVYCRQGDSSIKLTSDQVKRLEYDKKERDFEMETLLDSSIEDIDLEMMEIYKKKIGTKLSNEEVLKARGFLKERQGNII